MSGLNNRDYGKVVSCRLREPYLSRLHELCEGKNAPFIEEAIKEYIDRKYKLRKGTNAN